MTIAKRSRGRPKGSGKDDRVDICRVADLIVSNCGMSDWKAVNQVAREHERMGDLAKFNIARESLVRRLYSKWKKNREIHLCEAFERQHRALRQENEKSLAEIGMIAIEAERQIQATRASVSELAAKFAPPTNWRNIEIEKLAAIAPAACISAFPQVTLPLELMCLNSIANKRILDEKTLSMLGSFSSVLAKVHAMNLPLEILALKPITR
jgi:hypothetical protein